MAPPPVTLASLYSRQGERKYLNPEERRVFMETAAGQPRQELATLCLVLAYTGCRISEALALTPAAIGAGTVVIRSLKKRHGQIVFRELPVPDDLVALIARVHRFGEGQGQRYLWPLSRSGAWRLVKSVMQQAGVGTGLHATPKGLRHGFGLHAIRSGVPLHLVQKWLGHASLSTTAIYLQAVGAEEREFAARMWM